MSGLTITAYLQRLCQDMDAGRPLEPFRWRRALVPLAVPAVMGLAAGLGGCVHDEVCGDGVDNDRDGMVDCADHDCEEELGCRAEPEYGAPMPEKAPPAPNPEPAPPAARASDGGPADARATVDRAPADAAATPVGDAAPDGAVRPRRILKLPAGSSKRPRSKTIPRVKVVRPQVLYSAPFE